MLFLSLLSFSLRWLIHFPLPSGKFCGITNGLSVQPPSMSCQKGKEYGRQKRNLVLCSTKKVFLFPHLCDYVNGICYYSYFIFFMQATQMAWETLEKMSSIVLVQFTRCSHYPASLVGV